MDKIKFRKVEKKDLNKIFNLLQQLTEIDYSDRDLDSCWDKFTENGSSSSIVGLCDDDIIAYGSIVIENKIRGEVAGHIEDIVVDQKMRKKNIGLDLIKELVEIGKNKGCYRITLMCKENLKSFYEKNNFIVDGISMKKYLN
jgi:glucosamine-phosphate N-acetyltransferase